MFILSLIIAFKVLLTPLEASVVFVVDFVAFVIHNVVVVNVVFLFVVVIVIDVGVALFVVTDDIEVNICQSEAPEGQS